MRVLDLCCGAGGASVGYYQAFKGIPGLEIVGVDVTFQPNFPFTFVQGDARLFDVSGFDLVHVSPPCQAYTTASSPHRGKGGRADSWVPEIDVYRELVKDSNYVIENVSGAARSLRNPICLHGGSFGLGVDRPRLFESSFVIDELPYVPVSGPKVYGRSGDLDEAKSAMGIWWMTCWDEIKEAIPPAYTEHIGRCFLAAKTPERTCLWCGNLIPENVTRKWRYCSNAHRQRAYRGRMPLREGLR